MHEVQEIKLRGMMDDISKEELGDVFLTMVSLTHNNRESMGERFKNMSSKAQLLLMCSMLQLVFNGAEAKKGVSKDESGK